MPGVQAIFAPKQALTKAAQQQVKERNTRILAEAMFNPEWSKAFSKLRSQKGDTPGFAKRLAQLFDEIAVGIDEQEKARQAEEERNLIV